MLRHSFSSVLALGPLLALTTGCGASPEEVLPSVGAAGEEIKGGYLDPDDHAVVGIVDVNAGGQCSGSLIAPNLVLTARHCVSAILNEVCSPSDPNACGISCTQTSFGNLRPAANFYVTTADEFSWESSAYHAVSEVIGLPIEDKLVCGNDQAMLVLAANVDPGEAVPITPRVDAAVAPDEEYYAVGFGATSDSGAGSGQRRRRDQLFVDCVGDDCSFSKGATSTEWVGQEGICPGDSGGPAMDLQDRVTGVTSRGPQGCEDPVYGSVFAWAQWIKDTAIYAAHKGGYAAPLWATGYPTDPIYHVPPGAPCVDPAECLANLCVDDSVAQYCTKPCNEIAPCLEPGFQCDLGLGVCTEVHTACSETEPCPAGFVCDPGWKLCLQGNAKPAPLPPEPPATTKGSGAGASEESSCTVRLSGADPTRPTPWRASLAAAATLLVLRRRRR